MVRLALHIIQFELVAPNCLIPLFSPQAFLATVLFDGRPIKDGSELLYNFQPAFKSAALFLVKEAGPGGVVRLEVPLIRWHHQRERFP